jgi:hypothetical protein
LGDFAFLRFLRKLVEDEGRAALRHCAKRALKNYEKYPKISENNMKINDLHKADLGNQRVA